MSEAIAEGPCGNNLVEWEEILKEVRENTRNGCGKT